MLMSTPFTVHTAEQTASVVVSTARLIGDRRIYGNGHEPAVGAYRWLLLRVRQRCRTASPYNHRQVDYLRIITHYIRDEWPGSRGCGGSWVHCGGEGRGVFQQTEAKPETYILDQCRNAASAEWKVRLEPHTDLFLEGC